MIVFDSFADALDEARWSADQDRMTHYVSITKDGTYRVTPKYQGISRVSATRMEVGFTHRKAGRKPDV